MKIYEHPIYIEDVDYVAEMEFPWDKMRNGSILVSGATGLIGSFFVDVIMRKNDSCNLNCKVYALGRNSKAAKGRFGYCWENRLFSFVEHDINSPLDIHQFRDVRYVLHLASNTHPVAYASDPIGTISTNVLGTANMLNLAVCSDVRRFVFASSNEIYGENRGDIDTFTEDYCGYIDCNTLRAGYPESKRCGEALCRAYNAQMGLDVVIPRFTRSYGPTLLKSDTKALSQFIHKALEKENIILKSEGNQYYSYTYVADAVSGLLTVLLKGETCEAYNVSDENGDIRLKDLASVVAGFVGKSVVFENPDRQESKGYSTVTKSRLNGSKIRNLGWSAKYDIHIGIERTLKVLFDTQ